MAKDEGITVVVVVGANSCGNWLYLGGKEEDEEGKEKKLNPQRLEFFFKLYLVAWWLVVRELFQ